MIRRTLAATAALALALLLPRPAAADAPPAAPPVPDSVTARVLRALGGAPRKGESAPARTDTLRARAPLPPRNVSPLPPAPREELDLQGPPLPDSLPVFWRTRAERTRWHETADYDETMRYCRQLEAGSRWVKLLSFGTSGQGRDLPLLVVSRDRAFTPEEARATGKPIVLIQNGIHSGEIEGKDASLMLVRDMAVLQTRASLLDSCIVLVMPIYSADAHERSSRWNRINQNGPDEMGWRTTPIGLNLNRDYLKAEAPETRAFLANLYTTWWPDLLVDDHTTDGADYQHDVTYAIPHGPTVPVPIERWCVDAFEGRVIPRLAAMGHLPAPYLDFQKDGDPRSGIAFGASPPRFSTGYAPLQARAAILVETHMLKPYGVRVMATYDLLAALLEELRAHPRALTGAVHEAERLAAKRPGREVALTSHLTDTSVPFPYKGRAWRWETSAVTGGRIARWSDAPWDTILPLYREMAAGATVIAPAGYLVPREWDAAIALLQRHGVLVRRLAQPWRDTVEVTRIAEWSADPQPHEGHHVITVKRVEVTRRERAFRPGDAWVPLDQRGSLLAMNLCEAQAPDGFLAWNFFDTALEQKEYAESYVIDTVATRMMAADPRLAAEFQAKVAADSAFAKNAFARGNWFYQRSRWADPEQDLLPVVRALRPVPERLLEPLPSAAPSPGTPPRR
jgi:hypothetical protein